MVPRNDLQLTVIVLLRRLNLEKTEITREEFEEAKASFTGKQIAFEYNEGGDTLTVEVQSK